MLQFLDQQGYATWRQVNEGRYDPDRQQWYPHPNARRGVPDIIGCPSASAVQLHNFIHAKWVVYTPWFFK